MPLIGSAVRIVECTLPVDGLSCSPRTELPLLQIGLRRITLQLQFMAIPGLAGLSAHSWSSSRLFKAQRPRVPTVQPPVCARRQMTRLPKGHATAPVTALSCTNPPSAEELNRSLHVGFPRAIAWLCGAI
jgi:hypothetical protein